MSFQAEPQLPWPPPHPPLSAMQHTFITPRHSHESQTLHFCSDLQPFWYIVTNLAGKCKTENYMYLRLSISMMNDTVNGGMLCCELFKTQLQDLNMIHRWATSRFVLASLKKTSAAFLCCRRLIWSDKVSPPWVTCSLQFGLHAWSQCPCMHWQVTWSPWMHAISLRQQLSPNTLRILTSQYPPCARKQTFARQSRI